MRINKSVRAIAIAGILVAGSLVSRSGAAGVCQALGLAWGAAPNGSVVDQSHGCGDAVFGTNNYGLSNANIGACLVGNFGSYSTTVTGLDFHGNQITGCGATDTVIDGQSATDTAGCSSARSWAYTTLY
jgi:hypothetical protein